MHNVIFVLLQTGPATEEAAAQLDPVKLMLDASPVVKMVMLALVLMSVACWFIIVAKLVQLMKAASKSNSFLDAFWSGDQGADWDAERLEAMYSRLSHFAGAPVAAVFRAGYVELARVSGQNESQARGGKQSHGDLDNVERALKRTANNELTSLENLVPFLATTASTAPFVGLFGTVWGIMNSFIGIAGHKSASLDVVAPGIAEALIATAIGLAAAIPAAMAYNYFVRRIHVLESEMGAFSSDYLNIVRRHFLPG